MTRRRLVLGGTGVVALGAGAALAGDRLLRSDAPEDPAGSPRGRPRQDGTHQPGVDRPHTPQPHLLLTMLGWPVTDPVGLRDLLAALGEATLDLVEAPDVAVLPDGSGDLTVQVGLGPRLVALLAPDGPGTTELPAFRGSDALDPAVRGGDVVLMVAGSDPSALAPATEWLTRHLDGAEVRWQQQGLRPPGEGPRARNPLGFHDGIAVPTDAVALAAGVWIGDGPARGATIGVVRRFTLDAEAFGRLSPDDRDRVFGRRHADGAPLSGGTIDDDVDLSAKSPAGDYLVPADAHARAAHPSFTASALMMRRSYGITATDPATHRIVPGLLFISYQHDVDVFVRTQHRMDDMDRLMDFATPTAEATFLVLPGFTRDRPLGSALV